MSTDKANGLTRLGQMIGQARKAAGLTQVGLGEKLEPARLKNVARFGKATEKEDLDRAWQSLIARLERGAVADPSPWLLRAISEVLSISHSSLVGALINQKYGLSNEAVSPLFRDPLSLDQLADWEARQRELWIVTPEFVDEKRIKFRHAIATCLTKEDGRVIFFLPNGKRSGFERYKGNLQREAKNRAGERIQMVGVDDDHMELIAACYVFSNPIPRDSDSPTEGYLILYDFGAPYLALRMSQSEIEERIPVLEHFIAEQLPAIDLHNPSLSGSAAMPNETVQS